jgi:hypothetical protein
VNRWHKYQSKKSVVRSCVWRLSVLLRGLSSGFCLRCEILAPERATSLCKKRLSVLHAIVDCLFSNQYFFGQREADERGLRAGLSINEHMRTNQLNASKCKVQHRDNITRRFSTLMLVTSYGTSPTRQLARTELFV